jgi:hypothetical protein
VKKVLRLVFFGTLCGMCAWSQTGSPWQKQIDAARQELLQEATARSARAKLTLRVKDSQGTIVTNAEVSINIVYFERKNTAVNGRTNADGLFFAEGDGTDGTCTYRIQKEGYYPTQGTYEFDEKRVEKSALGRRWMPWNPTVDVVLKEKRKPIPLYGWRSKIVRFPKGKEVGFDCEKGDLLAPYGKGEQADFTFFYTSAFNPERTASSSSGGLTNRMVVSAGEEGGFIVKQKDTFSELWSVYQAPESGYHSKLIYEVERPKGKIVKDRRLSSGDYLIFKSRIKKNEKGEIISANYGKIYTFGYGEGGERTPSEMGSVMVDCYFNPTPNDRNIEADPLTELSSGKHWKFPEFMP